MCDFIHRSLLIKTFLCWALLMACQLDECSRKGILHFGGILSVLSFIKMYLSTYYVPGPVLGSMDRG